MEKKYIKPKAKINLTLNILGTREDGYHELESIFECIYLYDEMEIKKLKEANTIKILCNNKNLEKNNILIKAYEELKKRYKKITGIHVKLNKKIPAQTGLGGASGDCAYFILAMNKLFSLNMKQEEMEMIGACLGADVVSCIKKNTSICTGIGEKSKIIENNAKYYIIVIKPKISLSTVEMYRKYDETKKLETINNNKQMIKALKENNIQEISRNLYNDFEKIVQDEKEITESKEILLKLGADGALMTGSGSAVFGIFKEKQQAKKAYYELKKEKEVYYCIPYRKRG